MRGNGIAVTITAMMLAGCGEPRGSGLPDEDHLEPVAPIAPVDPAGPPPALTCVTDVLPDTMQRVLRVEVASGTGGEAFVIVRDGRLFSRHESGAPDEGDFNEPLVRPVTRVSDLTFEDGRGLTLSLAPDGLVLRGTLVDDQCYVHTELPVVCWNEAELLAKAPAHYDPATGGCVDEDGAPALNPIPVEVVRETRFGECADLRGAHLNGTDYSYPALDGWFLAGARLDDAELFFADLQGATLDGAHLGGLAFGYAEIVASIDAHTVVPSVEGCTVDDTHGMSITCRR